MQEFTQFISVGEENFIAGNNKKTCAWNLESGAKLNCISFETIWLSIIALKGNFN